MARSKRLQSPFDGPPDSKEPSKKEIVSRTKNQEGQKYDPSLDAGGGLNFEE
jgi:hypothetical protein